MTVPPTVPLAGSASSPEPGPARGLQPEPSSRQGLAGPLVIPEKLRSERWIALGVFALSLLYLCLFRRYTTLDPDEGIILQGAQRIVEGQVLYRDFFSYFTPGSYYLLAVLFKVFGSSMLVARTALAVYGAFISVFCYLLARRACSRRVALVTAYLVTLTCLPWRFMVLHNWDSTLWACATVYCAVWLVTPGLRMESGALKAGDTRPGLNARDTGHATSPHWGWALATGSFASLTILFEQSKGAGLLLGLGLGWMLIAVFLHYPFRQAFTAEAQGNGGKALAVQPLRFCALMVRALFSQVLGRRQWAALAIGLAWPFVLTFGYFAFHHTLLTMIADWLWPLHYYSGVNHVPYGYQDWSDEARNKLLGSGSWKVGTIMFITVSPTFLMPALPIIAVVLLAYWLWELKRDRLAADRAAYYILVCSSLIGLLFSVVVSRADIIHFVHLAPLLYLVLAWLMDGTDLRGRLVSSMRPVVSVAILFTFTALGMAFLTRNNIAGQTIVTRRGKLLGIEQDAVLEYVQAHVPADSKLLEYPYQPLYYYLTATVNPTRYEYLQPGMHSAAQAKEMIRELAADRTPAVLFEPTFSDIVPTAFPETPLKSLAYDPVADYILAHYRPCQVLACASDWKWKFVFMVRDDLACPDTLHNDAAPPSGEPLRSR